MTLKEIFQKLFQKKEQQEQQEEKPKKEWVKKYEEKWRIEARKRMDFTIFIWLTGFFLLIVPSIIFFQTAGLLIGLFVWMFTVSKTFQFFLVSVPEITGLLTINLFTGELRPYGTGLHFRYPWEQVKIGNYINLRLITQNRPDETYPSKDGPMMIVKWSFQYQANIYLLPKFIAVDETTINKGLGDVGSSFLSSQIKMRDALDCKKEQETIEESLKEKFEEALLKGETPEELYGIDLVVVSLADLDYEEKFQRVRASELVAMRLKEIAKKLQTGDITETDALNNAMIINGDIKKHVQEVAGKGGEALAALLMAMSRGGKE